MEVFGHFVFSHFLGFFRAFPFVYRLFRFFLFTILFRHFVLPPIKEVNKGNMKEETLLLIMDKYYWHISKGKKVYMGSKFGKPCIKDRAKSDSLRKAISLPPLKTEDFKNCEE